MPTIVDRLLQSEEPSIRWKALVNVLGCDPARREVRVAQESIRRSPRAQRLLAGLDLSSRSARGSHLYNTKWRGGHWVLVALADIGYPPGDESLAPLRDRLLDLWLGDSYYREFEAGTGAAAYRRQGVPLMNGRYRRCASQHGNALFAVMALGLDDGRASKLVERLLHWQWPDGGWNCDKDGSADTSSFMETLTPLRGLALYARKTGNDEAAKAARRAAEVFLQRKLFRRRSDGRVIHPDFTRLHYPLYWHYDILGGLKVLAELGALTDPRCSEALDVLVQKRLPDGGWPAESKFYSASGSSSSGADWVDWGGTSKETMNEWVTVDALHVLKAAGRV